MSYESNFTVISKNIQQHAKALEKLESLEESMLRFASILDEKFVRLIFPILFDYKRCLAQRLATPPSQPFIAENVHRIDLQDSEESMDRAKPDVKFVIHEEVNLNAVSLSDFVRSMKRRYVVHAIECYSGNMTKAAASLGVTRQSIYNILHPSKASEISSTHVAPEVSAELQ